MPYSVVMTENNEQHNEVSLVGLLGRMGAMEANMRNLDKNFTEKLTNVKDQYNDLKSDNKDLKNSIHNIELLVTKGRGGWQALQMLSAAIVGALAAIASVHGIIH